MTGFVDVDHVSDRDFHLVSWQHDGGDLDSARHQVESVACGMWEGVDDFAGEGTDAHAHFEVAKRGVCVEV